MLDIYNKRMIPFIFHNYGSTCEMVKGIVNDIENIKKEYVKRLFNLFEEVEKDMLECDKTTEDLLISKHFKSKKTMTLEQLDKSIRDVDNFNGDSVNILHSFEFFHEDKWQKIDWKTNGVIDLINQYYQ